MSMRRTVTLIVFSLAALVILVGCGGRVRYPNYYTINLPARRRIRLLQKNVHAAVAIREFRAPAYLRQGSDCVQTISRANRLFMLTIVGQLTLVTFVTNSVIERLRASGHFARVKLYDGRPDIQLRAQWTIGEARGSRLRGRRQGRKSAILRADDKSCYGGDRLDQRCFGGRRR